VYFGEGSRPGKVYCVDTSNGQIIWTASGMPSDAGAFMSCGALSHDEKAFYIGSGAWPEDQTLSDNRFYAIDTTAGKLKWIFRSQTHPQENESESGAGNYGSFFCDPAILSDGRIIAATFSGHVYCIKDQGDRAQILWDFEHIERNATGWTGKEKYHQEIWGSPAIDSDGTIYIGSNSGKIHAIDSSVLQSSAPMETSTPVLKVTTSMLGSLLQNLQPNRSDRFQASSGKTVGQMAQPHWQTEKLFSVESRAIDTSRLSWSMASL
ncbi:MAG: outer membrane protein assembly factor BamB family protein, partial [Planctomycetota bacterium]